MDNGFRPEKSERNLGEQPIAAKMAELGLSTHDVVSAWPAQLSHKSVSMACKGRRLTKHMQGVIVTAFNNAARAVKPDWTDLSKADLFDY